MTASSLRTTYANRTLLLFGFNVIKQQQSAASNNNQPPAATPSQA
jgi:hypothetical protein